MIPQFLDHLDEKLLVQYAVIERVNKTLKTIKKPNPLRQTHHKYLKISEVEHLSSSVYFLSYSSYIFFPVYFDSLIP